MDLNKDLRVTKRDSDVNVPATQLLEKHAKHSKEFSSSGTKLIDKIMGNEEKDLMEQIQGHLVGKASEILNIPDLCSALVNLNVLDEQDTKSVVHCVCARDDWSTKIFQKTEPELQEDQRTKKVIKAACSKKAIGSLVVALQLSCNEHIIQEMLEWLEATQVERNNYPVAVKSLANQKLKQEPQTGKSKFFQLPAPSDGIQKVASFSCQLESSAYGLMDILFWSSTKRN